MTSAPSPVVKEYPKRGPLQQFRCASLSTFTCRRCRGEKKSKLVVTCFGDWSCLLCNACYGRLLAAHPAPHGAAESDGNVKALVAAVEGILARSEAP